MRILVPTLATLLMATPAFASMPWSVDTASSKITFTSSQSGENFTGTFPTFTANVDFDPAALETSRVEVSIPLVDLKTGSPMRDDDLPKPEWLDVASYPPAQYVATKFTKMSDTEYKADGELTLRGMTVPVELPFTLRIEGNTAHVVGETSFNRLNFNIGKSWGEGSEVGTLVTVKVDLVATKAH